MEISLFSHKRLAVCFLLIATFYILCIPFSVKAQEEHVDGSTSRKVKSTEFSTPFVPFALYREETSALFGFMLIKPHRWENSDENSRPNTLFMSAYYTLKKQGGVGLSPVIYLKGDEYELNPIAYVHRSPSTFWGVGNGAGEHGDEEGFTTAGSGLMLYTNKRIVGDLRIGPSFRFGRSSISDVEADGLLDTGAANGSEGGDIVSVGGETVWDNRDSVYWPTTGGYYTAGLEWYRKFIGSDYNYEKLYFDFRRYLSLGSKKVLAIQTWADYVNGNTPFYLLPKLGGMTILRGLFEGRFRDNAAAAAQAELRAMPWKRFGGVLFAGVGEVASNWSEFKAEHIKWTGGVGLRISLDPKEKINMRLDVGVSGLGIAPMLMINEAF